MGDSVYSKMLDNSLASKMLCEASALHPRPIRQDFVTSSQKEQQEQQELNVLWMAQAISRHCAQKTSMTRLVSRLQNHHRHGQWRCSWLRGFQLATRRIPHM